MFLDRFEQWIAPAHLAPQAQADYAERINASPARMLVLDDFLLPERVQDLRAALLEAGQLEPMKAVYAHGDRRATAEEWDDADARARFYHHLEIVGPKKGFELSRPYLTHLRFRDMLVSPAALAYFSPLAGVPLNRVGAVNGKVLTAEHFLRPHNDAGPARRLCAVLYLSETWRPELGGEFLLYHDGVEVDRIGPVCNRLLLFVPDTGYLHAVAPMHESARDWKRLNYTFWFLG